MKNIFTYIIGILILNLLVSKNSFAQCPYDNAIYLTWTAPPTVGGTVSDNCAYGGDFVRVTGMIADYTYRISTCGNTAFDTQLSIWTMGGGQRVGYNDDFCGSQSEIYFTPLTNGSYDILLDEYPCATNTTCMGLEVELIYTPRPVITIPTVVHVLYSNATENIPDSQIVSQIVVLNEAYRRSNANLSSVSDVFLGNSADALIEFCLAQQDELGNPTNGITRTFTTHAPFTTSDPNDDIYYSAFGGQDGWNPNDYHNIWVANLGGGTLGWAYMPPAPNPSEEGYVVKYDAFGSSDYDDGTFVLTAPFDLGITAIHEAGHWLNLHHIWGDAVCGNDSVFDTPVQEQSSGNTCNTFFQTDACTGTYPGFMFMNFMDYSDDACNSMLTYGQTARIDAILFGAYSGLLTSQGCVPSTVGINENISSNNVSLFPNPNSGIFSIKISDIQNSTIEIFNVMGEKIFESGIKNTATTIDISNQANGIYYLKITSTNGISIKKIIISR